MNSFIKDISKIVAALVAGLTLITLVFSTILDGNDVIDKVFPPAPLKGQWIGRVEAADVIFCFEQKGKIIWGEFHWPGSSTVVSIDGIVEGNTFNLKYERVFHEVPDKGVYRLSYSVSNKIEVLEGYWKSEVAPNNRDSITLHRLSGSCQLKKFPFPG
tara:strand:- start:23 stop:496 length:474 start_codon:yes stop_codon:yes gene_type:complete